MSITEQREVIGFLRNLGFDTDQIKEVYSEIEVAEEDFTVNDYRFILMDCIDEIQVEELKSDLWTLGCFNSWFLADCSGLPIELIEAAQKGEQYEALGKAMLPHVEVIQEEYSRLDGYGHHFSPYDGNELELLNYFVFRIN